MHGPVRPRGALTPHAGLSDPLIATPAGAVGSQRVACEITGRELLQRIQHVLHRRAVRRRIRHVQRVVLHGRSDPLGGTRLAQLQPQHDTWPKVRTRIERVVVTRPLPCTHALAQSKGLVDALAELAQLRTTIADLREDAAAGDPATCSPEDVCRYL